MQNLIIGDEYLATHPSGWWGPSLVKVVEVLFPDDRTNVRVDVLFLEHTHSLSGGDFGKGTRHLLGSAIKFEPYNLVLENV